MGAWGTEPFANDDAADWSWGFEDRDRRGGLQRVESAFRAVLGDGYVELPDGSDAVAAAQVLVWLVEPAGIQESVFAEDAIAWVRRHPEPPDRPLVDIAHEALRRVLGDGSEIAVLWAEAGDDDWRAQVQQLDLGPLANGLNTKGRLMPETSRNPKSGTADAVGGVYALVTGAGDHRYIGRTANLERRAAQWARSPIAGRDGLVFQVKDRTGGAAEGQSRRHRRSWLPWRKR